MGKLVQKIFHLRPRQRNLPRHHNPWMSRTLRVIANQQFFIQFLTRAQAGVDNLYIAVRIILGFLFKAHQVNHLAGKVGNSYRLPHIQHKHLTTLPHTARLKHQLTGFGDGHEVANNILVSHRYRPAIANLVTEQWYNRARRPQHIAKAHHRKHRTGLSLGQALKHQLRYALGRPHHIGGAHRLIGRNQNKALNTRSNRRLSRMEGTKHIVLHPLNHIVLNQRYMLVRCRMINRLNTKGPHHRLTPATMGCAAQHCMQRHTQRLNLVDRLQLTLNGIQRKLGLLEQHQPGRLMAQNLAAQLRTNGTSGPGHQYRLAEQALRYHSRIWTNRVPAQEIFDFQIPNVVDSGQTSNQFRHRRHGLNRYGEAFEGLHELFAVNRLRVLYRKQHSRNIQLPNRLVDEFQGIDQQVTNHGLMIGIQHRHKSKRPVFNTLRQGGSQLHPLRPRTHNQNAVFGAITTAPNDCAHTKTRTRNKHEGESPIDNRHGTGHQRLEQEPQNNQRNTRENNANKNRQKSMFADVSNHGPIKAELYEGSNRHHYGSQ